MGKINKAEGNQSSFWDHLDELRKILFRIIIAVVLLMIVAFMSKELLFEVILAPQKSNFVLYRFFCYLAQKAAMPSLCPGEFHVDLINTQLASQFLIHMKIAFYVGVLIAFPYIVYQLFRFVSPALYANERKYAASVIIFSSLLFAVGVLLNYFLVFPFSFRFLATYQVSSEVKNTINLSSYIDTFLMLSLLLGIMSELPVISWLFARLGFLKAAFMKKYRKHATVIILILAAIITPTSDVFTLLLVFFPIYLLYEISILVVSRTQKKKKAALPAEETAWEDPYLS
jgi:sec-independent protein translocase protein TatC